MAYCLERADLHLRSQLLMGIFQMQVHRLPTGVHKEIDRYVRRCVWGESEGVRKMHLVSWDTLCRPKYRGGFGLKRAEGMNKSLLAKLGWRLLTQGDTMWARILRAKYGVDEAGPVVFNHKQRASSIWRGLEWSYDLLSRGLRCKVVDGRRIRFWLHCRLSEKPLLSSSEALAQDVDWSVLVRYMWVEGRGWDWGRVGDLISHSCLLKLAETSLTSDRIGRDRMGWLKIDGTFSVRSAHDLYMGPNDEGQWRVWKQIWGLRV